MLIAAESVRSAVPAHALLDGAGLVAAGVQGGEFGVHVGEGGGDGGLFEGRRKRHRLFINALTFKTKLRGANTQTTK